MPVNRRRFLSAGAAVAAGAAVGARPAAARAGSADRPNILVVIVDEMRAPQWFPDTQELDRLLPNIARIRQRAVSFDRYYTASNACTPARGTMLTGLYSHQTGVMLTAGNSVSTLSPGFPTWGTMLRDQGYATHWYGKWHLSDHADTVPGGMETYGFDGGTYPSPNGGAGVGLKADPGTATQFVEWLDGNAGGSPWCTTVSFLNPHDILYWNSVVHAGVDLPAVFTGLPPNFQTAEDIRRTRPGHQTAFIELSKFAFGTPQWDAAATPEWIRLQNTYLWYQQQVDIQIGRVLDALQARPEVAANTVVIFTADHGDYAGSHGLHGKGGAAYEEGIRVPLLVHDPRGLLGGGGASSRSQLVSSVDLAPLLLTVASGGNQWRSDARYAHLAGRADIASICSDPSAPGRPWVLHATDEFSIEESTRPFDLAPPAHILALITPAAKLVTYSHFTDGTVDFDPTRPQEFELYDYSTDRGRLELDNLAGDNPLQRQLQDLLTNVALPTEARAPLPGNLQPAQEQGLADFRAHSNILATLAGGGMR
ncbi:sulfatase-like hydrolase/transferase [Nocardia sp. NBC_01327]|uniref:sulfatase-like hydrolase/transferase n=1 Tax=Nocardia sp. NBC_01327 TaxID=2903593 RepID=UPI002E108EF8|nr:sulfatase-like hydrolase/transferase [Nocardia sp. NBC_01327]